jgi:acetyl-CoA/propionyl-CoA carboxylase carboxyl transferase subunit
VTVLDSRIQPTEAEPRPAPAANAPAAPATMTRNPETRLQALFDPGTVRLLTRHDDSGALAACGQIDGMPAVSFASDPKVQGGAMSTAGCAAIVAAYDEAIALDAPLIGLWHSGGARLREGVESLHAVGTVFAAMTRASGVVPQISVVLGAAAGGAAYGPALTDVVILSEHGRIFVTGPDVVKTVTKEEVDMARLGGPEPHSRRSGVVHVVVPRTLTRSSEPGNWPCCSVPRATSTWAPDSPAPARTARPTWAASCPSRPAAPTTSNR